MSTRGKTWTCDNCGDWHYLDRKACRCGQWRPISLMPMKKGDWKCCGEVQFASRLKCRQCGGSKKEPLEGVKKKRKGDWECCGELQFAARFKCRICGKDKPKSSFSPAIKKGDWICDCGFLQFGRNNTCNECERSKPTSENEDGCLVCFERVKNVAFVHGDDQHVACCRECANGIFSSTKTCPVCRKAIDEIKTTYI